AHERAELDRRVDANVEGEPWRLERPANTSARRIALHGGAREPRRCALEDEDAVGNEQPAQPPEQPPLLRVGAPAHALHADRRVEGTGGPALLREGVRELPADGRASLLRAPARLLERVLGG